MRLKFDFPSTSRYPNRGTTHRDEESILRILVTNDDGVYGDGLWQLVGELGKAAEIVVVAPDREQSGVGTAVTLHRPLRVRELKLWPSALCYATDGTPADCVILGLGGLCEAKVDMIFSGINEGANLGNDILISGTVGAALQGYFYGIPSVAISVGSLEKPSFAVASALAAALVERYKQGQLAGGLLLNVNVPSLPFKDIQGIEVTYLAGRSYVDVVKEEKDQRGRSLHWITRGTPEWAAEQGTDIWAMRQNKISITPLQSNLAAGDRIGELRDLCPDLLANLRTTGC
ncbi:MAG: 5'/3'-nucleotidase SurE [Chloroflexi bacterium]|nr:5'/3'-nucleotidase SurE [Chloroflexota bacterium]